MFNFCCTYNKDVAFLALQGEYLELMSPNSAAFEIFDCIFDFARQKHSCDKVSTMRY